MKEENFGAFLRRVRTSKKITIQQLAERSGISYSGISRIERNERGVPKPSTIKYLADALNESYELFMEKAGYVNFDDAREEYDYRLDPTVTPELRELLDTLHELPIEDQAAIINQAMTFAEGIKAKKQKK